MITTATRTTARRRAPRAFALALTAGALVVGTSACSGDAEAEDTTGTDVTTPAPEDTADETATTPPTEEPVDGAGLLDGTRQVDIQTYGSAWVTTTVEGGVTTVTDPAEAGGVPTTWVFEPVAGGTFQVRTTATTDGQPSCLSIPGDDIVTVATCDPAAADQQLDVGTLDQPDQVNISGPGGVVVADQEGGLAVDPDPSSPASVFTLVDRGAAEG
ncbi:hypothetical protein [Cellulomonas triticagri]|uniref:Ricin B lectin domain-containing protein n=1 Tax=Cellulomonas triticagri TaxID=2483352 RepID=A0A3M2JGD5_9CELL|nr:hypothetical protein [Cellulomonas triticagri]RMI12872.1 hypothetical protein EBM89_06745 [Cellulomonas triticagri]